MPPYDPFEMPVNLTLTLQDALNLVQVIEDAVWTKANTVDRSQLQPLYNRIFHAAYPFLPLPDER